MDWIQRTLGHHRPSDSTFRGAAGYGAGFPRHTRLHVTASRCISVKPEICHSKWLWRNSLGGKSGGTFFEQMHCASVNEIRYERLIPVNRFDDKASCCTPCEGADVCISGMSDPRREIGPLPAADASYFSLNCVHLYTNYQNKFKCYSTFL